MKDILILGSALLFGALVALMAMRHADRQIERLGTRRHKMNHHIDERLPKK